MTALFVHVRLVVPYPQDLCGSPAGERRVSGDLHQLFSAHNTVHFVHFRSGALVAPDDGLPQDVVVLVQHDQTVHLSGNTDALDLFLGHAALGHNGLDGADHGILPVRRILFCIAVFRLIHGIFDGGTRHNGAVFPE